MIIYGIFLMVFGFGNMFINKTQKDVTKDFDKWSTWLLGIIFGSGLICFTYNCFSYVINQSTDTETCKEIVVDTNNYN